MAFNYFHHYYGTYIGIGIRKQIGKKYIYQIVRGQQKKYPYVVPFRPNSVGQQKMTHLLREAVALWHTLSSEDRLLYDGSTPPRKTMSGFNYFISLYINTWK